MFFRSSSKQKEKEPDSPVYIAPKNPFNKKTIDLLIDLETKFNQSKITEETVSKLLEIYTVFLIETGAS